MTDCDFVLAELRRGPRCAMDIISASIRERGVGLTVHSRVAELRARGYDIPKAVIEGKTRAGRDKYIYRLVGEPQDSAAEAARHSSHLLASSAADDPGAGVLVEPDAPAPGEQLVIG